MSKPGERADAVGILSASIEVQSLLAVETIPGVVILAAAGSNGPGVGYLRCADHNLLSWEAPGDGGRVGAESGCSADGDYLLEAAEDDQGNAQPEKWIRVRVYASRLIQGSAASVYLRDVYSNAIAGDDVTAAEAAAGVVVAWQVAVTNRGSGWLNRIRVWLDGLATGLEVSPDGSDWSAPTTEAAALNLGDLGPGGQVALHLRRTIPAAAEWNPAVLHRLQISFQGF